MRIGEIQFPLILWWASIVHTVLGILILLDNQTASILIFIGLHDITRSMSPDQIGWMLILFSVFAGYGLLYEHKIKHHFVIALLFPQYILLIASFLTDLKIIIEGYENSDGVEVPTSIVISILWPFMAGAILHTIGIVERYFWKWPNFLRF